MLGMMSETISWRFYFAFTFVAILFRLPFRGDSISPSLSWRFYFAFPFVAPSAIPVAVPPFLTGRPNRIFEPDNTRERNT